MSHPSTWRIAAGVASAVLVAVPLHAQGAEPVLDRLAATFKQPYLSVGLLVQTVADFQIERSMAGENGFSLANARLNVGGELDNGFGYFFQANFVTSPAILDARLSYRPGAAVRLSVGQFKVPFSYEFLTNAANIDFVNRSQAVSAFAPARQLGAEVAVGADGPVGIAAGVFNGNGFQANGNDGSDFLYAIRASAMPVQPRPGSDARLVIGANAAVSQDDNVALPGVTPSFTGDRALLGADARFTAGRLLLAGEVVYARLEPTVGAVRRPWGFHATAGLKLSPQTQGLVRWDRVDLDPVSPRDLLIFGFNVWPTRATEIQVNYVVDTDGAAFDNHRLLANFQLGF